MLTEITPNPKTNIMKPVIICIVSVFLFIQNIKSQDSLHSNPEKPSHPVYFVKVFLPGGQTFGASLMNIKDSSIYLYTKKTTKPDPFHSANKEIASTWDAYNYKFIMGIKVRNKTLRSWLIPTSIVAGAIAGAFIAKNSQNQVSNDYGASKVGAAIAGVLVGGTAGAITSLIICSASEKKYLINGDWKSFEEMKKSMNY